jgi:hypothetical protein
MKEKIISFFIMASSLFLVNYFIFDERNMIELFVVSLGAGLGFALLEGYLKRLSSYIFRKIMKVISH